MDEVKNKKCRTCVYRASDYHMNGCDYILIEGHSRGCSVEECDRYIKGKRKGLNTPLIEPLPGTVYNNRGRRRDYE